MRRTILAAAILAVWATCLQAAAPQDQEYHRGRHRYVDELYIDSSSAITGTWSCASGSKNCTEDTTSGNALAELSAGDFVDIGGYSYLIESVTNDDTFVREDVVSSETTDALVIHTSKTVYLINQGIQASVDTIYDGGGTATALGLSTTAVTAASLDVGGGYGSTGCSVSAAGVLQCNGAATTDGAITADSAAIGGGYGSTGVSVTNAGAVQANGAINTDGALTTGVSGSTAGTVNVHDAGTIVLADDGNDTTVTLGPVTDGTTTLGVTGTINATGLQVGGAAVLTAEADTLTTVTGRGATTATASSFTGGLDLGTSGSVAGDLDVHDAGTVKLHDDGNDTTVTIGPVADGTTTLGVTGTIDATGLKVGGAAVLTAEAQTLAAVTALGATTATASSFTGGLDLGVAGTTAGDLDVHDAGTVKLYDDGNDTSVTIGPVADGTTTLGVTGTLNATGLQVGGTPVLTAETDGVVGNEVTAATDGTLTRSGAGSGVDPYTLGINLGNANTWTALPTVSIDGNNAATELLQLTNSNEGATGQTGDTATISFDLKGSTDSGSTWISHEAARIETYKVADFWGGDETDFDSGLRFYTTNNGSSAVGFYVDNSGSIHTGTGYVGTGATIDASGDASFDGLVIAGTGGFRSSSTTGSVTSGGDAAFYGLGLRFEGPNTDSSELELWRPAYVDADGDVTVRISTDTGAAATLQSGIATRSGTMSAVGLRQTMSQSFVFDYADLQVAATTKDLALIQFPARTLIHYVVCDTDTAATFGDTLTLSVGDTGAGYEDWLADWDGKSDLTVGDTNAERGDDLDNDDMTDVVMASYLTSFTAATTVYLHADGNLTNLSGLSAGQWTCSVVFTVIP